MNLKNVCLIVDQDEMECETLSFGEEGIIEVVNTITQIEI